MPNTNTGRSSWDFANALATTAHETSEWRPIDLSAPTEPVFLTGHYDYQNDSLLIYGALIRMGFPRFMSVWLTREYGLLNPNAFRLHSTQPLFPAECETPRDAIRAFVSASKRTDSVARYIETLFRYRCGVMYYPSMLLDQEQQSCCPVTGMSIPVGLDLEGDPFPARHGFARPNGSMSWWLHESVCLLENGEVYRGTATHADLAPLDDLYADPAGVVGVSRYTSSTRAYSGRVSGVRYPRWYITQHDDTIVRCEDCDALVWEDEICIDEDNPPSRRCEDCDASHGEREEEASGFISRQEQEITDLSSLMNFVDRSHIHNYNDNAASTLPSSSSSNLMGYELEWAVPVSLVKPDGNLRRCGSALRYEFLRCMATHVLEKTPRNYAIAKHDGSIKVPAISDDVCGFEFVSRPEDLATHSKLLTEFWPRVPKKHLSHDFMGVPLGMHIHLERNSRNPLRDGKLIMFLYNPAHRFWLLKLAERDELRRYAAFPTAREYKWQLARGGWNNPAASAANNPSKYVAVRMCRHTIELRFFRSQTELVPILRNLEFADAVKRFVASVSVPNLTFVAFAQWVSNHRKTHRNLYDWFAKTGVDYLPSAKKKTKRTK